MCFFNTSPTQKTLRKIFSLGPVPSLGKYYVEDIVKGNEEVEVLERRHE